MPGNRSSAGVSARAAQIPSDFSIYDREDQEKVLDQDVIYVGGGNTRALLVLWREWGLDRVLREAWESGIVLAGISAGSICWFEHGITDSIAGRLTAMPCLGLLAGSNCPHYDSEGERRPTFRKLFANARIIFNNGNFGLHRL